MPDVRVRPEQLGRHLGRGLAKVYVVHGDEPLQREESLDAIRAAARAAGYGERIVLHAEPGFDWSELQARAANLSLFAERRLIDLRVPGGSPGKDGGPALARYAASPPPDMVLLLSCGRLDRRSNGHQMVQGPGGRGRRGRGLPGAGPRAPALDRGPVRGARHGHRARRGRGARGNVARGTCSRARRRSTSSASSAKGGRSPWTTSCAPWRTVRGSGPSTSSTRPSKATARGALRILRVLREEGVEPFHVLGSLTWAIRGVCAIAAGLEGGARLRRCITDGLRRMVEQEARSPARPRTHAPPGLDRVAGRRRRRRPVPEGCADALPGLSCDGPAPMHGKVSNGWCWR